MDILSASEIRKRIRQYYSRDVSLKAIHKLAKELGYNIKRAGGKRGYHKSLGMDILRNWDKLLSYDAEKVKKTPKKPVVHDKDNYYMYNGEPDRKDYAWEIDDSVIGEAVSKSIGRLLSENYHGELYHCTTLAALYGIVRDDALYARIPDCSFDDNFREDRVGVYDEYGDKNPYVCLTRDKNYNIRGSIEPYVRITFDADELMKIRYAHLYPVNYSGDRKMGNHNEAEERFFEDIEPFRKYVKKVEVFINDPNETNWDWDDVYELAEKFEGKGFSKGQIGRKVNSTMLTYIKRKLGKKVFVYK